MRITLNSSAACFKTECLQGFEYSLRQNKHFVASIHCRTRHFIKRMRQRFLHHLQFIQISFFDSLVSFIQTQRCEFWWCFVVNAVLCWAAWAWVTCHTPLIIFAVWTHTMKNKVFRKQTHFFHSLSISVCHTIFLCVYFDSPGFYVTFVKLFFFLFCSLVIVVVVGVVGVVLPSIDRNYVQCDLDFYSNIHRLFTKISDWKWTWIIYMFNTLS